MWFDVSPRLRWTIWATALALWTFGLVTPFAVQASEGVLTAEEHFTVSKALHVGVYAGLTLLTAWLPASPRLRPWLLALLVAHGPLTEWVQCYVPMRFGSVNDVAIDTVGVALGVILSWRWWFAGAAEPLILKHPARDDAPADRQRSA